MSPKLWEACDDANRRLIQWTQDTTPVTLSTTFRLSSSRLFRRFKRNDSPQYCGSVVFPSTLPNKKRTLGEGERLVITSQATIDYLASLGSGRGGRR